MANSPAFPRILIVDDDKDQCQLLREALCIHYKNPAGAGIVCVNTAAQCLAQDLEHFDVVLLDYNLPDISGLDVLEKILERADIPIIFVTGENVGGTAAKAIRKGAQDYVIKLGDYIFAIPIVVEKNLYLHGIKQENRSLQLELQSMLDELRVKNIQLQESMDKLRMMATTDHLTGLSNRRSLVEMLDRYFSEAVRYGFDLTCCMCDLDHYKKLNDMLGHQVGDEVLVMAAEVIRLSLRSSDSAARYGGDEFVLLLPHTSPERGLAVGERIRHELFLRSTEHPKINQSVTMSIGVASLEADKPTSSDTLLSMADKALYAAKDRGKDHIVAFSMMHQSPQVQH